MNADDPRHGTYAGYNAHTKQKERPCEPCSQARNEYMRQWRAANPEKTQAELVKHLARQSAAWTLTRIHREEFDTLVAQELAHEAAS